MHILLAVDGSPPSILARDLVASLAPPPGSRVELLTACEANAGWARDVDFGRSAPVELRAELEQFAEPLREAGWTATCSAVPGRPGTVIVDVAARYMPDLIVLGSRGRGPLRSMLLGSVSAEVVDHAPCPVLVARLRRVSKLLVASDGSPSALCIPQLLGRWGVFRGLACETLCVATTDVDAALPSTHGRESEARARDVAEASALRLHAAGIPAVPRSSAGDPADAIIARAAESGTDLIILGTRGLSPLQRILLGSVARNVLLHAPCSVLVVRGRVAVRLGERAEQRVLAGSPA